MRAVSICNVFRDKNLDNDGLKSKILTITNFSFFFKLSYLKIGEIKLKLSYIRYCTFNVN